MPVVEGCLLAHSSVTAVRAFVHGAVVQLERKRHDEMLPRVVFAERILTLGGVLFPFIEVLRYFDGKW